MTKIRGWTPKTTLLLRDTAVGYDIIDHAFGSRFSSALLQELTIKGWIGDPSTGAAGRLQNARTKMDIDLEKIMQLSRGGEFLGDSLAASDRKGVRGDESAFISRDMRIEESFPQEYPMLHRLISSIENTASDHLKRNTNRMDANFESNFEINKDLTSVQLAMYPGDGKAGYPRHCDVGATCRRDHQYTATPENNERVLTFVYYLNPDDWDVELDGGALRMFSSSANVDNNDESVSEHYVDVTPFSDRMVVFRSDCIEHQVMPSLRRKRIAITVWLYGRVHQENSPTIRRLDPERTNESEQVNGSLEGSNYDQLSFDNSMPPPLPLPDSKSQGERDQETIFVAIPSYRDEETLPTIQSLLKTAHCPERVAIGVVWQVDTSSAEEVQGFAGGGNEHCKHILGHGNFRSISMDHRLATGPCYARHLAQTLHRGEDYVLQIDSHMRFRPNWDVYLIQQLNKCNPSINNKPPRAVLTAYPPNYDAPQGQGPNAETRCTLLVPWKFGEDGMLRQKGRLLRSDYIHNETSGDLNDNIPCLLFAGGFNFFHSELLGCCPYDGKHHGLFFGEEISMAVRLFTLGYNLYSPPQTVCYHKWERNPLRTRVPSERNKRNKEWLASQREASLELVRKQLQGLGRGLGKERTVEQFSLELGVNFDKFILSPGCENGKLSMDAFADSALPKLSGLSTSNGLPVNETGLDSDEISAVLKLVNAFIK